MKYYMTAQHTRGRTLSASLRNAIDESGVSFKALERESGVIRQSLMKFVREEQSLRLDMADKLADYFGLELRPTKNGKKRAPGRREKKIAPTAVHSLPNVPE